MTEREQRAIEWVMKNCPTEFINALAERIVEVFKENPQKLAGLDTTLIPTAEPSAKSKRFIKPTAEEIRAYCAERGNNVNAESFFNFYEANGWRVGKNAMKNWKASVRTWENRDSGAPATPSGTGASKIKEWVDPFLKYAKDKVAEAVSYEEQS